LREVKFGCAEEISSRGLQDVRACVVGRAVVFVEHPSQRREAPAAAGRGAAVLRDFLFTARAGVDGGPNRTIAHRGAMTEQHLRSASPKDSEVRLP
jgi:hypothetical protein